MSKIRCWVFGFLILTLGFNGSSLAATNADLAALSRARVVQFTGTERISQPFVFDLDVTVPHPALNFAKVVGQPLQVTVAKGRTVAGIVENIEQSGVTKTNVEAPPFGRGGNVQPAAAAGPGCDLTCACCLSE